MIMEFKDQLKKEFIPAIKEMVEKESEHLKYMVNARKKILKNNRSNFFVIEHEDIEMQIMIRRSKDNLTHLHKRLKEYIKYANKL